MTSRNVASEPQARTAPPVTAQWLERAALHYLERYGASSEMLRRTLRRRVDKRARARGEEAEPYLPLIEETVARAVRAGLVDDARFAATRLATLRRRGTSTRGAGAKLAAKGIDRTLIAATLAAEEEEAGESRDHELEAARAYARRRRLGPFRPAADRAERRARDLAAMARAGFSIGLARDVIEADPESES